MHWICLVQLYFESTNAQTMCPDVPSCSFSCSLCSYYHSFSKRSLDARLSQISFVLLISQSPYISDFLVQLQIPGFCFVYLQGFLVQNKEVYTRCLESRLLTSQKLQGKVPELPRLRFTLKIQLCANVRKQKQYPSILKSNCLCQEVVI